jgi:hypothetical protein
LGAAIAGAQVTASNPDAGKPVVSTSDAAGNFLFKNLPAGPYSLEAKAPGFAPGLISLALLNGRQPNCSPDDECNALRR